MGHTKATDSTTEPTAAFLRACMRLPSSRLPVWLMRQAGRYMPEYRAIRKKHSMLDVIGSAELAAEVTLQPIRVFGFDAAIIFADILPPLIGMGLDLEFVKGVGPRIHNAISQARDVDMLAVPPATDTMPATLEAIELVTAELGANVPLIGFAGAPFTLASYAIEGGGSKNYTKIKAFMYNEPAAWERLMTKLVTVQGDYLLAQAKAGAAALQVFDSWVGLALNADDYKRYVQPHDEKLFTMLSRAGVPTIHFSTGTGGYLGDVAASGGDVIGVDWRVPLDVAWEAIGHDRAIQGNLDPALLLAPWREIEPRVKDILDRAGGRAGHIFNLGHGIFPNTPVDTVRRLVDFLHEAGE